MSHPVPPAQPRPELLYGAPTEFGAATPAAVPHTPAPYSEAPYAAQQAQVPNGHFAVTACRMCGSVPAAPVTFRGHQGFIIFMRFLSAEGPFCRDCGLATFRSMTSRTLVQGWYGWASFIITPITVLINLVKRGKVANLGVPQPNPFGPSRPPMNPGKRLLLRPMTIIGLAIPVALLVFLITAITLDS
ncbi:hypothetical protein GCM10010435_95290 [Winogradskya consettensis]|uniref:Uncharacterized protein n=1 Tax=Winogradskya consettensis TaxID=113560 RepID=A0A919T2A4_9ACTN|nr:hypothetical protein [Actinoplanes consettensis]GIM83700.1 hypothetical protein Aco04nite_87850 [Actinoplanes consettensis]